MIRNSACTAVQRNVKLLNFLPEKLNTPELCLAAVQRSPWALEYVPEAILEDNKPTRLLYDRP